MMRLICIFLIFFMLIPVPTARGLSTKIQGKISLICLLLGIGVLTKHLIHSDQKMVEELHAKLGQPHQVVEYQKGFDLWRIEWYDGKQYKFRNGVFSFRIADRKEIINLQSAAHEVTWKRK